MSNKVVFFYYNKHGKKVEIEATKNEANDVSLYLLEASHADDIGDVFRIKDGITEKLDYYNVQPI